MLLKNEYYVYLQVVKLALMVDVHSIIPSFYSIDFVGKKIKNRTLKQNSDYDVHPPIGMACLATNSCSFWEPPSPGSRHVPCPILSGSSCSTRHVSSGAGTCASLFQMTFNVHILYTQCMEQSHLKYIMTIQ